LSYLAHTHTQTDRQTDKVWQKHYLLGRGNNTMLTKSLRWQQQQRLYEHNIQQQHSRHSE